MLEFFGTAKVRQDMLDKVLEAIRKYVPSTQDEDGTLAYIVYQHCDDPCRIVFYETYRDWDAKKVHNANPRLNEMMDVLGPATEGEAVMGFFDVIAKK